MSLDVYLIENEETVFDSNITHNLAEMADKALFYHAVWRPDEVGIVYARQLAPKLKAGIETLKSNPEHYKQFDADNKWGTYDQFLPWLEQYLEACEQYPEATITVSR